MLGLCGDIFWSYNKGVMHMRFTRREFLKLAGAVGVTTALPLGTIQKAFAGNGDPRVIWLQGQGCSGCSVSLLNSVNLTTVDDLLINHINMEYNSTLIAAAGDLALTNAMGVHPSPSELTAFSEQWMSTGDGMKFDLDGDGNVNLIDFARLCAQGYILVVEGAIPTGSDGKFCSVGGEMTMIDAFSQLSSNADMIIAIGTCAAYGGIPAASPNPTNAMGVTDALSHLQIDKTVINIPGCPTHPDWFVGTVVKLLAGQTVDLDSKGRPSEYFGDISSQKIHAKCPFRPSKWPDGVPMAAQIGDFGCLEDVGCKGKETWADCPILKWNSPAQGENGVNWCIGARTPCHGCVEPEFPDGMTPFFQ